MASSKSTLVPSKKRASSLVTPSPKKSTRTKSPTTTTKRVASLTAGAAVASSLAAATVTSSASTAVATALSVKPNRPLASASTTSVSVNHNRPLYSRTTSFDAHTNSDNCTIPIHTLILGTHPSIKSLEYQQYFGHPMNAFWWIAGDCLGFRRADGTKTNGEPYKFTSELRFGTDSIIPYEQQVSTLTSHGFALWDVVQSCQRKGSLDADIQNETPNDIWGFCQQHPTIQRIVLANGSTGCAIFNKHFKEWWKSGQLKSGQDEFSQRAFAKKEEQTRKALAKKGEIMADGITCVCAVGVSPAAARYTYKQKRDFWEQHVYQPGLEDYRESLSMLKQESS